MRRAADFPGSSLLPLAGTIAIAYVSIAGNGSYRPRADDQILLTALVVVLSCIPIPALLLFHLRGLAVRVRSPHLAEHCAIVAGGSSVALALFAITLWFSTDGVDFAGSSTSARLFASLLFVCLLATSLFLLWWMYLFVRFTIAFHRAASLGRKTWIASDLSAGPPADPGNAAPVRL